ncbi:hypothetical protein D9615_006715 [Tricholomella constricta]|uniref:Uncharacterized protein n=1 Tax=Tricholomella constricta TaxID=117010 RepID=A0A8H5H734_9AGAR|nr:hypothetical protein D9615_006715 [Tricholomella constricta]
MASGLEGKPHPRWADSNFRDGDPNEKWHSRATKCPPLTKRRLPSQERPAGRTLPSALSPIKTEPVSDTSPSLYRFSPSPGPAPPMRYHTFQTDVRSSSTSSYDHEQYQNYHPSSCSPTAPYHAPQHASSVTSSYSDSGSYTLSSSDDGSTYHNDSYPSHNSTSHSMCPCRTSPGTGVAYISLAQQLQTSLNSLRQYSHHPPNTSCLLYRRIVDLNHIMHGNESPDGGSSYENGASEREILTPLSASSGHTSFHTNGSSGQVSPQEWTTLTAAGYNPYFPPQNDHGIYTHVIN